MDVDCVKSGVKGLHDPDKHVILQTVVPSHVVVQHDLAATAFSFFDVRILFERDDSRSFGPSFGVDDLQEGCLEVGANVVDKEPRLRLALTRCIGTVTELWPDLESFHSQDVELPSSTLHRMRPGYIDLALAGDSPLLCEEHSCSVLCHGFDDLREVVPEVEPHERGVRQIAFVKKLEHLRPV